MRENRVVGGRLGLGKIDLEVDFGEFYRAIVCLRDRAVWGKRRG